MVKEVIEFDFVCMKTLIVTVVAVVVEVVVGNVGPVVKYLILVVN